VDFTLSPDIEDTRRRIGEFVETHVLPVETDRANLNQYEMLSEAALAPLRAKAKAEGLWALQMPKSRGGGGLSAVGMAACYEEMGRSPFGPLVFNSAAPDDGNMMLLNNPSSMAVSVRPSP
jgi:acyl-CoA dehydrogenase